MNTKKLKTKKLKAKCWRTFSNYIRMRDCLETTGTTERGRCCTCGKIIPYKGSHAGHFLPGRHNANLFDEHGCHLQCVHCNTYLQGAGAEYYKFMLNKYGQKEIDRLMKQNRTTKKWKPGELKELEQHFRDKIGEITCSKNLPF